MRASSYADLNKYNYLSGPKLRLKIFFIIVCFLHRSIFLLDDRITVLKAVDKNGSNISRLLGFLQFRKHCALMKLVNQLITGGRNETESIDSFKEDLTNSLNEAWMILEHDSGCPDELTSIISLLNTQK